MGVHGRVVAHRQQVAAVGGEAEDAARVARLAAVLPPAGRHVAVHAARRELLVVDARPVVVPGGGVERVAMHDQRPDAVRALAPDLAEVLPLGIAEVPVDVPPVGLVGRVGGRGVEGALEHRQRVGDVVRRRRRPAAVEPARLACRRRCRTRAAARRPARCSPPALEIALRLKPVRVTGSNFAAEPAGGAGPVGRNLHPEAEVKSPSRRWLTARRYASGRCTTGTPTPRGCSPRGRRLGRRARRRRRSPAAATRPARRPWAAASACGAGSRACAGRRRPAGSARASSIEARPQVSASRGTLSSPPQ